MNASVIFFVSIFSDLPHSILLSKLEARVILDFYPLPYSKHSIKQWAWRLFFLSYTPLRFLSSLPLPLESLLWGSLTRTIATLSSLVSVLRAGALANCSYIQTSSDISKCKSELLNLVIKLSSHHIPDYVILKNTCETPAGPSQSGKEQCLIWSLKPRYVWTPWIDAKRSSKILQ